MSSAFTAPLLWQALCTAAATLSPVIVPAKIIRDVAPRGTGMPYVVYSFVTSPPPEKPTYGRTSWIDGDLYTMRVIAATQAEADTISRNLLLQLPSIRPAGTLGIWIENPIPPFPIIPEQKQFGAGRYVRVRQVETNS